MLISTPPCRIPWSIVMCKRLRKLGILSLPSPPRWFCCYHKFGPLLTSYPTPVPLHILVLYDKNLLQACRSLLFVWICHPGSSWHGDWHMLIYRVLPSYWVFIAHLFLYELEFSIPQPLFLLGKFYLTSSSLYLRLRDGSPWTVGNTLGQMQGRTEGRSWAEKGNSELCG